MKSLIGKVALVSGASSGIGRATAIALAEAGCDVTLAARRAAELESTASEVQRCGRHSLCIPTDVTDQTAVEKLVADTIAARGRLDIVVACAGAYLRCPIESLTAQAIQTSFNVNFFGAVNLVLAALPLLRSQRSGHIVLVISMDAKKGIPPDAPYVSAKYALAGFGDVLRQELRGTGVDVSLLFPGRVDTPMISGLEVPWLSAKITPEAVAKTVVDAINHRRAEVILPAQASLLIWLDRISPRLGDWAVRTFRLEGWAAK